MQTVTSAAVADVEIEDALKSHSVLLNHALSYIKSMCLKGVVELRIPDAIRRHGRPTTISELLSSLSIPEAKSRCLGAMMGLLSTAGIFKSHNTLSGQKAFDLTPASRLLLTASAPHHPNLSPFILYLIDSHLVDPCHQLSHWFHRSEVATTIFEMAHGTTIWGLAGVLPEFNDILNKGLASDSVFVMDILRNNGGGAFQGIRTLVDVGGGTGLMAAALVEAFPGLKCCVLDLPHVIETAEKLGKIQFVRGDMFVKVPPADAVLLKLVLHTWSDEDCIKILQRCKEAIPPKDKGGKVIIIEIVVGIGVDTQNSSEAQLMFDLQLMILCSGKERNEGEWHKLFMMAGFSNYKITPLTSLRSIIEVYP